MFEVRQTDEFAGWLKHLKDDAARQRIAQRLLRVSLGDVASVGEGVGELRVHHGPGYRLYFVRRGREIIVLLCGGDKSTQDQDIKRARQLAKEV